MNWPTWITASTLIYPFFTRFLLSLMVLVVGVFVSQFITKWLRRVIVRLFARKQISDSPLGEVVMPAHALRGSGLFSSAVFAVILFLFIALAGEILGITFFAQIVGLVLGFVPNLLSAFIILILGFLLAGVVERLVKQKVKTLFPEQAFFAGTVASCATIILFVLMALAELGIAREFILILFAGVSLALALAFGLAVGLGSRAMVEERLRHFVPTISSDSKPNSRK